MQKRVLSFVLVLAMVLSMVPVSVIAAGAVEKSPKADTHTDAGHADDCGLTSGWTEWTDATSLPAQGQIILKTNVNLTAEIVLTGDLTICLNGFVITAAAGKRHFSLPGTVATTLTITDCTAYTENDVYYAGALTGGTDTSANGGGSVLVGCGSTMKLYDGRITGNVHKNNSIGAGAIMLQAKSGTASKGGQLYMYGGELSDNQALKANGSVGTYGGAIYADTGAAVEITGGTLADNIAGRAGAIYAVTDTNVTIKNAKLTGNEGSTGGVIGAYNNTNVQLENVTIHGNTGKNGSAIYMQNDAQVSLKNCTITGNTGTNTSVENGYSAAIYAIGNGSKLTVSGKTVIADNTTIDPTVPDIVMNYATSDTLWINELADGSRMVFATRKTAPTNADEVIKLASGAQQTAPWQSGWVRYMAADGSLKDVGLVNNEFVWGHYHGDKAFTALANADQLTTTGNYYLAGDVKLDKEAVVAADADVVLCLNGHDLTPADGARVMKTDGHAVKLNLTIDDCTAYTDGNGVYHAGAITGANHTGTGGVLSLQGGSHLILEDGKITDNIGGSGGAIILWGAMTMNGGEISNNKAGANTDKNGGGIYLNNRSTIAFTMNGGTIKGNSASRGGGIYYGGTEQIALNGGTITGNSATLLGGGVYLAAASTTKLTGKLNITGNTCGEKASNVHLLSTAVLQPENLDKGSRIGITLHSDRITAGVMYFTTELAADPGNFASDDSAYKVELKDKKLTLVDNTVTPPPVVGHKHNGCDDASCTKHAQIDYKAWTDKNNLPTEGSWYLDTDVTVSAAIDLTKDVDICLNGHTVRPATGNSTRMYTAAKNAGVKLTIADCTAEEKDGVYTAGKITGFAGTKQGAVVEILAGNTFELFDGIITGNTNTASGGALFINCVFNMYGGEISDNQAGTQAAPKNGGGMYLNKDASFTMRGGAFKNNTGSNGGAIYCNHVPATISNATFTGNVATQGGALCTATSTTLVLSNCTFSNNTGENGGAVTASGGDGAITTVRMENCTVTGNTATTGGSVYIKDYTDLTLAGKNTITGNQGGNLYLYSGRVFSLDNFSTESSIGVSADDPGRAISTDCANFAANFTSDNVDYSVKYQDGKLHLVTSFTHTHCVCGDATCTQHQQVVFQPWNEKYSLPDSGNYCLLTDVELDARKKITSDLTLCLHGHSLTATGTNRLISTEGKVTLTITDCTAKTVGGVYTAGKITGGTDAAKVGGGALFISKGSTLKLYEGLITGNRTLCDGAGGGAIMLQSGTADNYATFYMYGGEISGNKACSADGTVDRLGGGIYAYANSVFVMEGGTIKNNEAGNGGGIYANNARLTLNGGTIEGNTAATAGGGIAMDNGSTIGLSGNVTVLGNTVNGKANNLYLDAQTVINVVNATGTVGVNAENPGRAFTEACADYSANFTSDDAADYKVTYQDGKLWLVTTFAHEHCVCGDATCTQHEQVEFQPWKDGTKLPENGGNYCLLTDVELDARHKLTSDLTLCLHGHSITATGTNRLISTEGKVTLTITDCTAKTENGVYTAGKLTGGTDAAKVGGGALFISKGSTLKLYEGLITGNRTLCDGAGGGAIMLQSGTADNYATFYMYGGEISGNKACSADGTADRLGGGVYAYANSVFVMEDGTIKNNEAGTGGGVYASNARLTITGGTIEGNTAATAGGGIALTNGSTIDLSGAVTIMGNTAKGKAGNLCLEDGQKIKLGTLDKNAKVGVSGQPLTFITEKCADYTANFLSDNSKYQPVYTEGAVYLDATGNHKHCFCSGITTKCDHTVQTYVEWDDPTTLPDSGNYYLSVDVKLDAQVYLNSTELNLCLNGHTITITNNRAFNMKGNSVLRISDCAEKPGTITGAKGGAILTESNAESKSLIELYNGILTGNENASLGGAILIQGGSTFNMYGGKITGNALHCKLKLDDNGKPVLDAKGNQTYTSSRGGGGVGLYGENTTFNMYGGEIDRNMTTQVTYKLADGTAAETGGYGGGVYSYMGDIFIHGGKITGNTADRSGGGLFGQGGIIELTGGEISGNKAGASGTGSGGGFYASTNSTVNITGGVIAKNSAKNAGGFYANTGSQVTMSGGQVSNNTSVSSGGGVMLSGKNVVMTLSGGEISGNKAKGSAGGLLAQSRATLKMTGGKITGNTADGSGGGAYISANSFLTLTGGSINGNKAAKDAGGVMLNRCEATIRGSSISYNATEVSGGGIKISGAKLTASGLSMVGNTAKKHAGAIITSSSSTTTNGVTTPYYTIANLYSCRFSDNTAGSSGGAMLIQSKGTVFNMTDCVITDNQAKSSGGGAYISTNVTFSMKGGKFTGNKTDGSGGAARLHRCTAELSNVLVENNTAKSAGGLYLSGANNTVTAKNVQIVNNVAAGGSGGGVYAGGDSQTTTAKTVFTDSVIRGNVCEASGGGLYVTGVMNITMDNVELSENRSVVYGGGMYLAAGCVATMNNVQICDNKTEGTGGGIMSGGILRATGSVISGNTATVNGGGISTHKSAHRLTQTEAGTYLTDCLVTDNSAGAQGGGVYNFRGGPVYLENVSITGNESAQEGSGIMADGILEMTDVTIEGNTSLSDKYALYVTPADYDGHTYYSGRKNLAGNMIIQNNNGGDMYMDQGIVASILGNTLGDKASVNVTLSDGVLTQRIIGVYHYEGEGLTYTLTAGDRSITEPMKPEAPTDGQDNQESATNVLLYVGIGAFAVAVVAVVVLLILKKKKAGKSAEKVNKE